MLFVNLLIPFVLCSPIPPDQDDFYTPPPNITTTNLGDILKIRPIPTPIKSIIPIPFPISATYQLLFRTQDIHGTPIATVTTLIIPSGPVHPNRLISHQSFENSPLLRCAPSYAVQSPTFATLQIQADLVFVAGYLNQGYVVNLPDHEGPHSSFLVGLQAGYVVLDSIRAATTFLKHSRARVALVGYSGGGFASLWASLLVRSYAPDLDVAGVVSGGTIANITAFINRINGGPYAGLIVNILGGLCTVYADFNATLLKYGQRQEHTCLFPSAVRYFFQDVIGDVYHRDVLCDPTIVRCLVENDLLGKTGWVVPGGVPVFLYHSRFNEMAPFGEVVKLEEEWCRRGVEVEIAEDWSYNHMVEAYTGIPAAITWIENQWNRTRSGGGCKHVTRLTNLNYPGISPVVKRYYNTTMQIISDIT
ncbi:Lipase 7 [Candida viswanathii]|uniref:Lipase 7 n=1 Tax=Candida viswanathii TaxID=5486 RepID=A0A367YJH9_9ASCO|nr:Lipase 7 [Candida viswanathii]